MNDFIVRLITRLDSSKTVEDIKKIERELSARGIRLKAVIDLSSSKQEMQNFAKQLQSILSAQGLNIDTSKILSSINQVTKEVNSITSKVNRIKLSVDEGNTSTQISILRAKFEKLGFTQDEVARKMNAVMNAHNSLTSSLSSGDDNAIIAANDKFNQSLVRTDNLYKQIKTDATQYYNATRQTKLSNDIQNWMSKNTAATRQAKTAMQQFLAELNGGRVNVARLDEISSKFQSIDAQMRSTGKLGKSFIQIFSEGIKKFSYWTSSTFLVMKTIQTIKKAVTSVRELDTALVDLKKTTTMTVSQLNKFYYSANDVAKQMGVTTKQIIDQASAWSRLGYSSNDAATKMAKYSSQFASISPGMDVDTATDGLVSIMKAFDISEDNVLDGIMSKVNEIGNTAATSNNEIVNMLSKSSSAMMEANNTLEETIALETAA